MKRLIRNHWVFIFIFISAAILRLFRIEILTSFQGDQGRDLMAVLQMIVNRDPTLLGPPSTFGPFQGPLYYYLLLPGLILSNLAPIGGLIVAVIFNITGLALLYIFCLSVFDKKTAAIASFLYAFSSFSVEIGHTLLNAYFGLPVFIGALIVLKNIIVDHKRHYMLLGLLVGMLTQLHYNFAPFVIFCLTLPFFNKNISKKTYLPQYIGMFFVATLPQIIFELRHEFLNTHLLLTSLRTGQAMGTFSINYISFFFSTIGYLLGWQNAWFGCGLFAVIAILFLKSWNAFSITQKQIIRIVVGYGMFFLISAVVSKVKIIYPAYHYYMTIIPIVFVVVGIVLSRLSYTFIYLFLILFTGISIYNLQLFRTHGFTMVDDWNLVEQKKFAARIAADLEPDKKWNIASVVDGDTQALPFRYLVAVDAFAKFGKDFPKPLGVEQYPNSDILYLATRDDKEKVFNYTVWEVASLQPFKTTKEWKVRNINLFKIERIKD